MMSRITKMNTALLAATVLTLGSMPFAMADSGSEAPMQLAASHMMKAKDNMANPCAAKKKMDNDMKSEMANPCAAKEKMGDSMSKEMENPCAAKKKAMMEEETMMKKETMDKGMKKSDKMMQ